MEQVTVPKKTMTVKEVAAVLGVTERTVQRYLKIIRAELDNVVKVQNGISSSISEAEVTVIKKKIEQSAHLAPSYDHTKIVNISKTNLEIITRDDTQYINARDLHASLGVGRDFSTWIKERIEKYGFIEGKDFSPKLGESTGGRPTIEYDLSLSMAKELAIVENNEKGKQIRQYLIKVEQAWNTPEMIMARALQVSNKTIHLLHERLALAERTIEVQKPKAEYYDTLIDRGNSTNLRNTAKELGLQEKQFIKQLQLDGYLYRDKQKQLCPYAEYMQKGYFEMKEWQHGKKSGIQTLITVTGKQFFIGKYKRVDIST